MGAIREMHSGPAVHLVNPKGDLRRQGHRVGVETIIVTAYAIGDVDGKGWVVVCLLDLICRIRPDVRQVGKGNAHSCTRASYGKRRGYDRS